MGNKLQLTALAAIALAGCTQNEVVEYAESRAIQFGDAFIGNQTRAAESSDTDTKGLKKFYVTGKYGETNGVPTTEVFDNVAVTKSGESWTTENQYWVDGKKYWFAAYANGNDDEAISGVTMNNEGKLSFSYTSDGTKDLVYAKQTKETNLATTAGGENNQVSFTFGHVLSKVKFSFNTTAEDNLTIKIEDIKIESLPNEAVYHSASATQAAATPVSEWTLTDSKTTNLTYDTIDKITNEDNQWSHTERYVIPQSNENLKVTFKATITDDASLSKEASFTGNLAYSSEQKAGEKVWEAGNVYNYQLTINPENIDPDLEQQVIEFTVTEVKEWNPGTDIPTTPDKNNQD